MKHLCKQFDGVVYLTARDVTRGQNAIKELEKQGLNPKFHQLDITDESSISTFHDYLEKTYQGLDVLVNNAAIAFKVIKTLFIYFFFSKRYSLQILLNIQTTATEPFSLQAEETLRVNYFSLRKVCSKLYPLLKPHARVVHVSSSSGHLSKIPGESLKKRFSDPNLTEEQLDNIMHEFIEYVELQKYTNLQSTLFHGMYFKF